MPTHTTWHDNDYGCGDKNATIHGIHCQFYEQQPHLGGKAGTWMFERETGKDLPPPYYGPEYYDDGTVYASFKDAVRAAERACVVANVEKAAQAVMAKAGSPALDAALRACVEATKAVATKISDMD